MVVRFSLAGWLFVKVNFEKDILKKSRSTLRTNNEQQNIRQRF